MRRSGKRECAPRSSDLLHSFTYSGPPPPSGGTQVMIWYGSMMSQVLQCTQLLALICSLRPPPSFGTISYTAAGQKCWQGLPYSRAQRVSQTPVSATRSEEHTSELQSH